MIKKIYFLWAFCVWFSCTGTQNPVIKGQLENSKDYFEIKLWKADADGFKLISQADIDKSGGFKIKPKTIEQAGFYALGVSEQVNSFIFLDKNSKIEYRANVLNMSNEYELSGDEDAVAHSEFIKGLRQRSHQLQALASEIKKAMLAKQEQKLIDEKMGEFSKKNLDLINYSKAFSEKNQESIISIAGLEVISYSENTSLFENIRENLKKTYPDNYYATTFLETLIAEKKAYEGVSAIKKGAEAPNIIAKTIDGKDFNLKDMRGKYVVLDFWASWCAPCRMANPHLLKTYNKFKSKNVEFVGISLDTRKTSWEKAILKDKLPWVQIGDLKGWDSDIAALYSVTAIPRGFIIDPNGMIVSAGVHGLQVEQKLDEIINKKN